MNLPWRLVVAASVLFACVVDGAGGPADPAADRADESIQRFRALSREEGGGARADKYLRSLPPAERLAVARAILEDRDARIAYAGASVLVAEGHLDEAVPALAAMVADGRVATDHVRFGYDWLHSDDDALYPRMTAKIGRHLLSHLGEYGARERARAEEYLMGGQQPFSRTAAEHRLAEIEEEIGKATK